MANGLFEGPDKVACGHFTMTSHGMECRPTFDVSQEHLGCPACLPWRQTSAHTTCIGAADPVRPDKVGQQSSQCILDKRAGAAFRLLRSLQNQNAQLMYYRVNCPIGAGETTDGALTIAVCKCPDGFMRNIKMKTVKRRGLKLDRTHPKVNDSNSTALVSARFHDRLPRKPSLGNDAAQMEHDDKGRLRRNELGWRLQIPLTPQSHHHDLRSLSHGHRDQGGNPSEGCAAIRIPDAQSLATMH